MTKFLSVATALAGLVIAAASGHAETRDHRGQPKQFAAPKTCTYYCPPGSIRVHNCGSHHPSKTYCRDHRK